MGATSIEWCDHSINPIKLKLALATGPVLVNMCTRCSPGCENCYSESMTRRFWPKAAGKFPGFTAKGAAAGEWVIDRAKLEEVLRRRKPTRYFWCDMTDMFHPSVPFELIDQCFAVMALTPHHTHMVLTKRPERMAAYLTERVKDGPDVSSAYERVLRHVDVLREQGHGFVKGAMIGVGWPLRNVWLGCSPVNQATLEQYLPHLLRCPAAVRFLSLEPLLGPIKLPHRIWCRHHECYEPTLCMDESKPCFRWQATTTDMIDWIIVGGESGAGARPFETGWARSIIEQCRATGIRCFVKQLGSAPFASDWEGCSPPMKLKSRKGGDPSEWPEDLRVREFPKTAAAGVVR